MKKLILLLILLTSYLLSFSQVDIYQLERAKRYEIVNEELVGVNEEENRIAVTGVFNAKDRTLRLIGENTRLYALTSQYPAITDTGPLGTYVTSTYDAIDWEGDYCSIYIAVFDESLVVTIIILYLDLELAFQYTGTVVSYHE